MLKRLSLLQYSDSQIYNQLRHYAHVFDVQKAIDAPATGRKVKEELEGIQATQAYLLEAAKSTVDKYLDQCGRRWVNLETLFSFMKVSKPAIGAS